MVCAHVERTPRRRPVSSAAPQPDIARIGPSHGQSANHVMSRVAKDGPSARCASFQQSKLSRPEPEQTRDTPVSAQPTAHVQQRPALKAMHPCRTRSSARNGSPSCWEYPSDHDADAPRPAHLLPTPRQTGHHRYLRRQPTSYTAGSPPRVKRTQRQRPNGRGWGRGLPPPAPKQAHPPVITHHHTPPPDISKYFLFPPCSVTRPSGPRPRHGILLPSSHRPF